MPHYKNKLPLFALGASILSLSACGSIPNSIPSGYTYHHDTYKSAAPLASSEVTVEQRQYMDAVQAEQFRNAVYDLLERMTLRAGLPPKPVYVAAPDPMTTFYANIDNNLRESMRHIGYAISDMPEGAYVFAYEAGLIPSVKGQGNSGNNVTMTLRVFSELGENARQLTEESGQYFIKGADSLDITASRYGFLPSQEKIQTQQIAVPQRTIPKIEVAPVSPAVQPIAAPVPQFIAPTPVQVEAVKEVSPVVDVPPITRNEVTRNEVTRNKVVQPVVETAPLIDNIPTPPPAPAIEKVISTPPSVPVVEKPTLSKVIRNKTAVKKPSHDDIVIINRGDTVSTPPVSVEVDTPMVKEKAVAPATTVKEPVLDPLQRAIPTTESAVRGRVSLPAEY